MIPLGNANQGGAMQIAQQAARLVTEHGQVAVLLGIAGNVVAVPHHEPGYDEAITRRAPYLCGVYKAPENTRKGPHHLRLHRVICNDMVERWKDLRAGRIEP